MNENKTVITNIESKTKANRFFTVRGIMFVFAYVIVAYMLRNNVADLLFFPYIIFSLICAIFFILPSAHNKGRNNLESIFILLRVDKKVYRAFSYKEEDSEEIGYE